MDESIHEGTYLPPIRINPMYFSTSNRSHVPDLPINPGVTSASNQNKGGLMTSNVSVSVSIEIPPVVPIKKMETRVSVSVTHRTVVKDELGYGYYSS